MNKKFLSAILFGALMVTSTGTFVSCKDYDDDIENLQGQIDKNSSAIAELKKLVGAGNWVTSISPVTGGFTVTMSNGQSQTITGINGADGKDGKNGTEWTIGEDGFWYMDGEKTDNVAIGKNGENGVTAPSPSIGADGNWIVYNWDAEKGEFVAEATEIPAQGTAAYAVEANGVITLHIADANGEYMEIALPSTCDSFVVEAPYKEIRVVYETSKWTEWEAADEDHKAILVKAFPELAEIEKNTVMKQGGMLPLIVNPASVELTNDYKFSLQTAEGKVAEIALSNPVKGLVDNTIKKGVDTYWFDYNGNGKYEHGELYSYAYDYMETRAAADDCHWGLSVEPAYNEKTKTYASASNVALVVENAKGTAVKTPFVYNVNSSTVNDFSVSNGLPSVKYAEAIDVLAPLNENNDQIFYLTGEYNGYFVLELTNAVQVEKYGLSVEGSVLKIANMPANETSIPVSLKLTAVGLNGAVRQTSNTIYVQQEVGATAALSDQTKTLSDEAVEVRWKMEELGMNSAVQLDNFLKGKETIKVYYEADKNEDGNTDVPSYVAYNDAINYYNAKGEITTYNSNTASWSNGTAVEFGFDIEAARATLDHNANEHWLPTVYTVAVTSTIGTSTVIYSAEAQLTVQNPELTADYIKLVPAFVENGVFQITGTPGAGVITYPLADGLIYDTDVATLKKFIDMDYNAKKASDLSLASSYNWVPFNADSDNDNENDYADAVAGLSVNTWMYKPVPSVAGWYEAEHNQLYEERNIRAVFTLFNDANEVNFDYKVIVKSELYTETVANAVTFDATKLVGVFGAKDADGNLVAIDIKAAITKALVQAGTDKGKTYNLFATGVATSTPGSAAVINYLKPLTAGTSEYLVKNKNYVEAPKNTDMLLFGFSEAELNDALSANPSKKYYLTKQNWRNIWFVLASYYDQHGKRKQAAGADVPILDEHKPYTDLFVAYKDLIDFTVETPAGSATSGTSVTPRDPRLANVVVKFAEPAEAVKYFSSVANNGVVFADPTIGVTTGENYDAVEVTPLETAPNNVTGGQVKVKMTLTIQDKWGMIMNVPFDVVVKTVAE